MRLLRLKLENWRSVTAQEIQFGPGVTLVEGPNEIGKSSLAEALGLLFRELDSSRKAAIRAIQPVGRDVGSAVEAEIRTGPYHFTYAKAFNRSPATTLHVHAPRPEQLAGREAHARAWALMEETVDTGLWQALQLEQGKEITQARLQDSQGLTRALDAAAGIESATGDDGALRERVQAEYLRYYTEKTGKSRFTAAEAEVSALAAQVRTSREALVALERDVSRHEALRDEIHACEASLPQLRHEQVERDAQWQAIVQIQAQMAIDAREVEKAELRRDAAQQRLAGRRDLIMATEAARRTVTAAEATLQPTAARRQALAAAAETAVVALEAARRAFAAADETCRGAAADRDQLARGDDLHGLQTRLARLDEIRRAKQAASQQLAEVQVDEAALGVLRAAETRLRDARTRLEAAAPRVEIRAHRDLVLRVDGVPQGLAAGESVRLDATGGTSFAIADLATVAVRSSTSMADLQHAVVQARGDLEALLARYGVDSLADATAQAAARREAGERLATAKLLAEEVLQGISEEEIRAQAASLERAVGHYLHARCDPAPLPTSRTAAEERLRIAEAQRAAAQAALARAQAARDESQEEANGAATDLLLAEQDLTGKRQHLAALEARLGLARAAVDESDLEQAAKESTAALETARTGLVALQGRLDAAAPETIQALYANARAALERALTALQDRKLELAGVSARLEQGQADGLFERLAQAEAALEAAEERLTRTRRQAAAARRLWETLERHRQAARQAYVRPLSERIDRLGRIVFGPDFAIELDAELTMVRRTLDRQTVPFEHLSVGAREQLGILARLAAAQLVSAHGGVPLILDDTLGYTDPQRLRTMSAVIAQAGRNCQVIVLTCTPGRFSLVGDAQVVRLRRD